MENRQITLEEIYYFFKLDNVRERMKFDAIMEKLEDIPENELDEFLNKY